MNVPIADTVIALKAHLALNVRNVAISVEFYQKMLGLAPSKVRTGYAKFDVQNPPLNLTLNEVPFTERGALSHLGIQVASTADVLALRARWLDAGLSARDEMGTNCCYAIQDKTWVRDPDGNEWEAFVVLKDNLSETEQCGDGDVKSCGFAAAGSPAHISSVDSDKAAGTSVCCGTTAVSTPVSVSK